MNINNNINYYLYVSRAHNWSEKENGETISKEEWSVFVEKDDELKPIENMSKVNYFGESIYWQKGEIYCIDPDEVAFYKMLEIANTIDAIVRGNDGRIYLTIRSYNYPPETTPIDNPVLLRFERKRINKNRPLWKKILHIDTA